MTHRQQLFPLLHLKTVRTFSCAANTRKVTSVEVVSSIVIVVSADSIVTLVVTPGTMTVTEDLSMLNTVSYDSTVTAVSILGIMYKVVLSGISVDPVVVCMVKIVPSMSVVVGLKLTVVVVVAAFVTTSSVLVTVTSVEVELTLSSVVGASSPVRVVSYVVVDVVTVPGIVDTATSPSSLA